MKKRKRIFVRLSSLIPPPSSLILKLLRSSLTRELGRVRRNQFARGARTVAVVLLLPDNERGSLAVPAIQSRRVPPDFAGCVYQGSRTHESLCCEESGWPLYSPNL